MILRSERLVMRPLVEDDVDALAELHGIPEVVIHLEQFGDLDAGTRVARAVAEWRERGFGLMAITEPVTGRFLGRCGLQSVAGHSDVELGWVLRPGPGDGAMRPRPPRRVCAGDWTTWRCRESCPSCTLKIGGRPGWPRPSGCSGWE